MSFSQDIRQTIRERAKNRCEYCQMPDEVSMHGFQIDHVLPKKHDGDDSLDNLAWSCAPCNRHKGAQIAGYDPETGHLTELFNPRSQAWNEQFQIEEARIIGLTAVGRVTAKILEMNQPNMIASRRILIEFDLF